jgi:tetratricopeptide (TPR) repeat protein
MIGTRIRITTQLIDARSGHHLWAEKFDRDHDQLFAVQDEVVSTIVGTLAGRLSAASVEVAKRRPPASLAAYECVLRADALPIGLPEAANESRRLLERAIQLDPGYARAYAFMANTFMQDWMRDMSGSSVLLDQSLTFARKSVQLDDSDAVGHDAVGNIYLLQRSYELAEYHLQKALELNPSRPTGLTSLGLLRAFSGQPADGVALFEAAKKLDPYFNPSWYWRMMGTMHLLARDCRKAIVAFHRAPQLPGWAHAYLAACHAHLGSSDEVRHHAAEAVRAMPNLSLARLVEKDPVKDDETRQYLIDGLRNAGLPE